MKGLKLGSYRLEDEHGERQPESSHYLPPIRHFRYLKTAILFSRILNIFLPPTIQCSLSPSFNLSWGRELNRGEEEVWLWEQVCNRAGSRDGGPRDNLLPDVWPPKSATSLGLLLWSTTWKGTRKKEVYDLTDPFPINPGVLNEFSPTQHIVSPWVSFAAFLLSAYCVPDAKTECLGFSKI